MRQDVLTPKFLNSIGEHFLAGHIRCASESPMLKYAMGLRELFAKTPLHIDTRRNFSPCASLSTGTFRPICNGLIFTFPETAAELLKKTHAPQEAEAIANAMDEYWKPYGVDWMWQGHATLDYATLLQHGLPFYQRRIQAGLRAARKKGDSRGSELFEALSVVLRAINHLIRRFIAECGRLINKACAEELFRLRRMRETFEQMRLGAPGDFYQAMQYVHFFNAVDGFDNTGRLDQYLYPFYIDDRQRGRIDAAGAEDLFADLFDIWASTDYWNVVIGGSNADGTDASNELTYIIMRARNRVHHPKPNLSLRLSSKAPDGLLMAACETLLGGKGQPAIYNDDLYVRTLESLGFPRADAAEFVFGGCSETHIAGKSAIRDGFWNSVKPLLAALRNGALTADGGISYPQSSPPQRPRDFDAVLEAYKNQVRCSIDRHVAERNAAQKSIAKFQPALVRSIFVSGCIEKGMNNSEGGAVFNHGMIDVYGIPNVANSLYVIKKLVYEDEAVSWETLIGALANNFRGREDLRMLCLRQAKYGNDIDEVDLLAAETSDFVFSYIQEHKIWNGGIFYGFCASAPGQHAIFGEQTGATPDGRLAGSPLANSMGPVQGTDRKGPTAALNSVSKVNLSKIIGTPVVNLSFRRSVFSDHPEVVISLIRAFFSRGGMQLQFNIVDRKNLMEALERPQEHAGLIVRVSGYSAYFTHLSKALQEEIIERTVY